jgi:hypothetical protein
MNVAPDEEVDKIEEEGMDDIWTPCRALARANVNVLRKEQIAQSVLRVILQSLGRIAYDQVHRLAID